MTIDIGPVLLHVGPIALTWYGLAIAVALMVGVWDLGASAILWWVLRPRMRGDGRLFGVYLALYAVGKFLLTFLRTETVWVAGLQEAQLLSAVLLALGAAWFWWPRLAARPRPSLPGPAASA